MLGLVAMPRQGESPRRTRGLLGGRSDRVVSRVLDAAVIELGREGYACLRLDQVASRAGVNKTTVYRRWPSRAALVTALVERLRAPLRVSPLPDTGRLEGDLVEAFSRRAAVGRTGEGRAWARLLEERHRPEVEAIIGAAVDERGAQWRAMVARATARGELPAGTEPRLVLDLVRATVDGGVLGNSRRLDRAWVVLAVRTVVAGARAGALVSWRTSPPVSGVKVSRVRRGFPPGPPTRPAPAPPGRGTASGRASPRRPGSRGRGSAPSAPGTSPGRGRRR